MRQTKEEIIGLLNKMNIDTLYYPAVFIREVRAFKNRMVGAVLSILGILAFVVIPVAVVFLVLVFKMSSGSRIPEWLPPLGILFYILLFLTVITRALKGNSRLFKITHNTLNLEYDKFSFTRRDVPFIVNLKYLDIREVRFIVLRPQYSTVSPCRIVVVADSTYTLMGGFDLDAFMSMRFILELLNNNIPLNRESIIEYINVTLEMAQSEGLVYERLSKN